MTVRGNQPPSASSWARLGLADPNNPAAPVTRSKTARRPAIGRRYCCMARTFLIDSENDTATSGQRSRRRNGRFRELRTPRPVDTPRPAIISRIFEVSKFRRVLKSDYSRNQPQKRPGTTNRPPLYPPHPNRPLSCGRPRRPSARTDEFWTAKGPSRTTSSCGPGP